MLRDWKSMKAPVLVVTATLTIAILLAGALLIATGSRGEDAPRPRPGKMSEASSLSSSPQTQGSMRRALSFQQRC